MEPFFKGEFQHDVMDPTFALFLLPIILLARAWERLSGIKVKGRMRGKLRELRTRTRRAIMGWRGERVPRWVDE